jgi:hypothetical protein
VVGDDDRDVVVTGRQFELALEVVLEDVEGEEAVVEGSRRAPVRVVVVPERRCVLAVGVVVLELAARGDDVHGMAVVAGRDVATVKVDVGVEAQPVLLSDDDAPAGLRPDRGAGIHALVAVDGRLEPGQDVGHALLDRRLVVVRRLGAADRQQLRDQREVPTERLERGPRLGPQCR